jgi:hypothetical protein
MKVKTIPGGWLKEEIEVDAKLVLCGMRGGMSAIMEWGLRNTSLFPTTDKLTKRVFALKKQPDMYIQAVSERVDELEKQYPGLIP